MVIYWGVLLAAALAAIAILGASFAIVGAGHRKAWVLALPGVIAAWVFVAWFICLFQRTELLALFWCLALPVAVCVAAHIFRRWREAPGIARTRADRC